jgi:hypothetical protein
MAVKSAVATPAALASNQLTCTNVMPRKKTGKEAPNTIKSDSHRVIRTALILATLLLNHPKLSTITRPSNTPNTPKTTRPLSTLDAQAISFESTAPASTKSPPTMASRSAYQMLAPPSNQHTHPSWICPNYILQPAKPTFSPTLPTVRSSPSASSATRSTKLASPNNTT